MAVRTHARTGRHPRLGTPPTRRSANTAAAEVKQLLLATDVGGAPWIMLCAGDGETPLMCTHDIPATRGGLLRFNQTNAMFAAAMAWAHGIDCRTIAVGASGFSNTVEQAPGAWRI